jgi:hypothetical protein
MEQDQNLHVVREFARRKTRQIIATVPAILAIIPLVMLEGRESTGLLGLPAVAVAGLCIAVFIGVAVFSLKNWRCPACNGYLGKSFSPRFCPKCGAQLQA